MVRIIYFLCKHLKFQYFTCEFLQRLAYEKRTAKRKSGEGDRFGSGNAKKGFKPQPAQSLDVIERRDAENDSSTVTLRILNIYQARRKAVASEQAYLTRQGLLLPVAVPECESWEWRK